MTTFAGLLGLVLAIGGCQAAPLEKRHAPSALQFAATSNVLEVVSVRSPQNLAGVMDNKRSESAQLLSWIERRWAVPVNVGGEQVYLVLDTGSSDTWIVHNGFECLDDENGYKVNQAMCHFGPTYNGTFQEGQIKDENFKIPYMDGTIVSGVLGHSDVTIGGVKVTNQEIALVDKAYWTGDNFTSGILGLAYKQLTAAFRGADATRDDFTEGNAPGNFVHYSPIVQTMIAQGLNPPLFSVALQRSTTANAAVPGGYVAFGGLPPVNVDARAFVSTPILIYESANSLVKSAGQRTRYTISVDGFVYNNQRGIATFHSNNVSAIVDTGASFLKLPADILHSYLATFSAPYVFREGSYYVPCGTKAPELGITIAGTTFNINSTDLVFPKSDPASYLAADGLTYYCTLGLNTREGSVVLGDTFLKNVVAVFDLGKNTTSFAPHVY